MYNFSFCPRERKAHEDLKGALDKVVFLEIQVTQAQMGLMENVVILVLMVLPDSLAHQYV